jgi:Zn-dependent peptidase ImmA (M78 family)
VIRPKYKTTATGVPVIKNSDIDADVELLLSDYDATLLVTPQPVDIEDFAENYLNLNLHFDNLSHNGSIWGMMVFNNRKIPVYVSELNRAEYFPVDANTIVLDNSLLEEKREVLLRSTLAHECGHSVYHRQIFEEDDNQLSLFPGEPKNNIAMAVCRKTDIAGGFRASRDLKTDHDWIEHHAKYFSAATLMPRSAMRIACEWFKAQTRVRMPQEISYQAYQLERHIASTFYVSQESAGIRIKQLGLGFNTSDIPPQSTIYYTGGVNQKVLTNVN